LRPSAPNYVLYFKPNIPLALIEAKDNSHSVGDGMQQGLEYATTLNIPFVFSSNGDGFAFPDRTVAGLFFDRESRRALQGKRHRKLPRQSQLT
jgi:type I site-specific restriction endonuclease